jgi:DNA-directed RNA polymerase subunit K/omega
MSDIESDYYSDSASDSDSESEIQQNKVDIKKKTNIVVNAARNFGDYDDIDSVVDDSEPDDKDEDEGDDIENEDLQKGGVEDIEDNEEIDDAVSDNDEDDEHDDEPDDEQDDDNKISNKKKVQTNSNKSKNTNQLIIEEDDDEYDDDDENYLQKFDNELNKNYISEFHPECLNHNYDEVLKLSKVVRNEANIIIDPFHKTLPYLTKYEKARVLGQRAKQIETGAKPLVKVPENIIDGYVIAELELREKKIPFIIKRPIPSGGFEYWKIKDLENINF